jgi:succinylglutamate desuccinylase
MKKEMTIKTNRCNKMKNMVKMNIMINKSMNRDWKKTKKRNKNEKTRRKRTDNNYVSTLHVGAYTHVKWSLELEITVR